MPKIGELIDVYDTEKDKYIMESATREEVSKRLGVPTRKISYNLYTGYKLNGKYLLARVIGEEPSKKTSNKVSKLGIKKKSIPQSLLDEWDEVRLKVNPNAKPYNRSVEI